MHIVAHIQSFSGAEDTERSFESEERIWIVHVIPDYESTEVTKNRMVCRKTSVLTMFVRCLHSGCVLGACGLIFSSVTRQSAACMSR